MNSFRASPSSCTSACFQLNPSPASTAMHMPRGRLCSHRRALSIARPLQLLSVLCRAGPVFCHCSAPLHLPVARPSKYAPAYPWAITSFQCCVHIAKPRSPTAGSPTYLCAHNWPQPLLSSLAPTATYVFTTGHCHYTHTCWGPQPRVCIPQALARQLIDCPGPLQLTLETMLRTSRASEVSADPCNICQGPWNYWCRGLKWLDLANHNTCRPGSATCPLTWPHTIRHGVMELFSTPSAVEDLSLLNSVHEI